MKQYRYIFLSLLLALVAQATLAQTAQDALYIFRNDGSFNAFFYEDIDHIEYSKIDTLGVEQADYVVQEVYALDSIFRIPLSAIDSVSFVTPEIKYKADVILLDKSIADYITASDTINWIRLANNTPENLIPHKGDKILIEQSSKYVPEGFGGRVTSVEKGSDGYTVTTEALAPEEAFERAIFKGSFGTQPEGGASTRGSAIGGEETIEMGPYTGRAALGGSKDLINIVDLFAVTASPEGEISYSIKPTIQIRSFMSIDGLAGVHLDSYASLEADVDLYAKVAGTLAARLDAPFPKIGFFKGQIGEKDQPFYLKGLLKLGLFIEGTGEAHLEGGVKGRLNMSLSMKADKPLLGIGSVSIERDATFTPPSFDADYGIGEFSIADGLFFEAALEFNNPLTKEGQLGFGHRAEFAPRILMKSVALTQIPDDLVMTLYGFEEDEGIYARLDRDDIFTYKIYASWDPYVNIHGWQFSVDKTVVDLMTRYIGVVPDINVFNCYIEPARPFEGIAKYEMQRPLAFPCRAGLIMYDWKYDEVETYWRPESYWNQFSNTSVEHIFTFDPLVGDSTYYFIHPVVEYAKRPILYYEDYYTLVKPAYANTPEKIVLNDKKEDKELFIDTNIPNVEFTADADWVEVVWSQYICLLTLKHDVVPPGEAGRTCTLHMKAMNSKGEVLIERDIPVVQEADEKEEFTVTPTSLSVPGYSKEFQGGNLTQQITVTYPKSAKSIQLTSSDETWLTVDKESAGTTPTAVNQKATYNVYIAPNTSLKKARDAKITIELTKADGSTATKTVTVNQAAMEIKVEIKPEGVILEAEEKEGAQYSDTKSVTVEITPYDDYVASLIQKQEVKPDAEWIEAVLNGSIINIRGEANPVNEDRENTVTYTLTLTSGDVITKTIKVTQLKKASNEAFTISTSPLRFKAEGGEITVVIQGDNVDYVKSVDFRGRTWLGGAGMNKSITVLCQPNDNPEERVGDFYVTVVMKDGSEATQYFMVYQDGSGETPVNEAKVAAVTMIGKWYLSVNGEPVESSGEGIGFGFTKENSTFSTRINGDNLHVTCKGHAEYDIQDTKIDATLSFDIIDFKHLDSDKAKIANVVIRTNSSNKIEMNFMGVKIVDNTTSIVNVDCTDIPLTSASYSYIRGYGTVGDGVKITNYQGTADQHATYSDPEMEPVDVHTTYDIIPSAANSMEIAIWFDE